MSITGELEEGAKEIAVKKGSELAMLQKSFSAESNATVQNHGRKIGATRALVLRPEFQGRQEPSDSDLQEAEKVIVSAHGLKALVQFATPLFMSGGAEREIALCRRRVLRKSKHFRGITEITTVHARGEHGATLRADCIHRCVLRCGRSHSGEEELLQNIIAGECQLQGNCGKWRNSQ